MSLRRLALSITLAALGTLGLAATALAASPPALTLDIHHNETNFPPEGVAEYWFDIDNVGGTATTGPITLIVNLPSGLSRSSVRQSFDPVSFAEGKLEKWSCPGSPGDQTVECTTSGSISRHRAYRGFILAVNVEAEASRQPRSGRVRRCRLKLRTGLL
jgi:hypothetical protein